MPIRDVFAADPVAPLWTESGADVYRPAGRVGVGVAALSDEKFTVDLTGAEYVMTRYAGSN